MYRLGWFSTGRDRAARDLLTVVMKDIARGGIEAGIEFVFCSRERGEAAESDRFLELVGEYGLPLVTCSYQGFKSTINAGEAEGEGLPRWRLDYDREVMKRLAGFHPDLCVLAGYMLIVGQEMCRHYDMINLHPAAPGGPKGTWQEVIWQLIEGRAGETGVMMHLVTPELDMGPPVTYCTFPIRGQPFDKHWSEMAGTNIADMKQKQGEDNPLFRLIRQHGLAREFPLIVATLRAFSQGRVRLAGGQVVDAAGRLVKGYNLTGEINREVEADI